MKTLISLLIIFTYSAVINAQGTSEQDEILRQYFIGTWTHERSVFPSGNVTEYYQEFELYEDGTGLCIQMNDGVLNVIIVIWKVKEGKVYLYSEITEGKIALGDVILISHFDEERFFGVKAIGPEALRKTCYYKRKDRVFA